MKVLIIAAHPDDETLGAAGAIQYHVDQKDEVFCVYFTDGVGARIFKNEKQKQKQILIRKKNFIKVSKYLNFDTNFKFNSRFQDNKLDQVPLLEIIRNLQEVEKFFQPNIIYTHHENDLNIDHQIIFRATLTVFRPSDKKQIQKICSYEVPSSTECSFKPFSPNYYLDINKYWKKKIKALKFYKQEMLSYPNSRSYKKIISLMETRGSEIGLKKAEAFKIIRELF